VTTTPIETTTPKVREAIETHNEALVTAFAESITAPPLSEVDWEKRAAHWKARAELNEEQARVNADTIKAQAESIRRLTAQLSRATTERNLLKEIVREMGQRAVTLAGETRERTVFSIYEEEVGREMCCDDIDCNGSRHQQSGEELRAEYLSENHDRD
jgi:hypothetical protein